MKLITKYLLKIYIKEILKMDNINHFLNLEIMKLAKQIEIYTEVLRVHHQNLKENKQWTIQTKC